MKTNEIFEHVLQIVCEECELCYGELINGANKKCGRRTLPAHLCVGIARIYGRKYSVLLVYDTTRSE